MQAPLALGFGLFQYLWRLGTWRQQQGFDVGLGQFALTVQRHLPQQTPASWQGQRFAMLAQVLAQLFGERASTLIAQGMQARLAQDQQRSQRRAVFLDNAKPRFGDPVVGCQRLFQHRQRDAFFFQFDDPVQSPEQFETAIGCDSCGVRGVFDMVGRQVGRGNEQRTVAVLAQLDAGEGLPEILSLAPGNAAGFRAAEDFRRPLAQAVVQALSRLGR
ncbi:hypothetical protein D3C87_1473430 [compost metagenome]